MNRKKANYYFLIFVMLLLMFGCIKSLKNYVPHSRMSINNTNIRKTSSPPFTNTSSPAAHVFTNRSEIPGNNTNNSVKKTKIIKNVSLATAINISDQPVLCAVQEHYVSYEPSHHSILAITNIYHSINFTDNSTSLLLFIPSSRKIYLHTDHHIVLTTTFVSLHDKPIESEDLYYNFSTYVEYVIAHHNQSQAYISSKDALYWYMFILARIDTSHFLTDEAQLSTYSSLCLHTGEPTLKCKEYLSTLIQNDSLLLAESQKSISSLKDENCDNYAVPLVVNRSAGLLFNVNLDKLQNLTLHIGKKLLCGANTTNISGLFVSVFLTSYAFGRSVNELIFVPKVPSNFTFNNITYTKKTVTVDKRRIAIFTTISCRKLSANDVRVTQIKELVGSELGSRSCSIQNAYVYMICDLFS